MSSGKVGGQPPPDKTPRADSRAAEGSGKPNPDGRSREALDRDAEEFHKHLRKPLPREGGQELPQQSPQPNLSSGQPKPFQPMEEGMASIIGGMAGLIGENMGMAPAPQPPATEAVSAAASPISVTESAQCDELVSRILVSAPNSGSAPEVRLKLDEAWLPKTEVSLLRGDDGALTVEFFSESVESQRFLLPNLGGLRTRLAENLDSPQVTVRMSESMAGGDNQEGRRSRERRNLYEEMGEH